MDCGQTIKSCITPNSIKLFGNIPIMLDTVDGARNVAIVGFDRVVYKRLNIATHDSMNVDIGLDSVRIRVDTLADSTNSIYMDIAVHKFCPLPENCKPIGPSLDCGGSVSKQKFMLLDTSNIGQFPLAVTQILGRDPGQALAKVANNPSFQVRLTFLRNDCAPAKTVFINATKTDTISIGIQSLIVTADTIVAVHNGTPHDSSYAVLSFKSGCRQ